MSECVVRMDMPENCTCCPMVFTADVPDYYWCAALEQEVEQGLSRPKECPIICPLPDGHGRLVDKDAFEKDVSDALIYGLQEIPSEEGKQLFHVFIQEVLDNVKERKILVPAESLEEDI